MTRRGDGIGIEIGSSMVRGVRLAHDVPGRLTSAAEEAINRPGDEGLLDALVRLAARLAGPDGTPTRLAWFDADSVIRAIDVTGRAPADGHPIAAAIDGVTATTTLESGARRWVLAVRWDHERSARLAGLAGQAGLTVAGCEPAPIALARVLPSAPVIARRAVEAGSAWDAVIADGVPRAAAATGAGTPRQPDLAADELGGSELKRLPDDDSRDPEAVRVALDGIAQSRFGRRTQPIELLLTGDVYPPYAPEDARSPSRQAVALGAAVAAAGLTGRVRAVEPLAASTTATVDDRRPWVVERLPDDPPPPPARRSWWRRLLDRARRRPSS